MTLTEAQRIERLQAELFKTTEGPQGEAWISDESGAASLPEFFSFVESHLFYNREASRVIAAFLRKHRALKKKCAAIAPADEGGVSK
jgi:hypothetical protein